MITLAKRCWNIFMKKHQCIKQYQWVITAAWWYHFDVTCCLNPDQWQPELTGLKPSKCIHPNTAERAEEKQKLWTYHNKTFIHNKNKTPFLTLTPSLHSHSLCNRNCTCQHEVAHGGGCWGGRLYIFAPWLHAAARTLPTVHSTLGFPALETICQFVLATTSAWKKNKTKTMAFQELSGSLYSN